MPRLIRFHTPYGEPVFQSEAASDTVLYDILCGNRDDSCLLFGADSYFLVHALYWRGLVPEHVNWCVSAGDEEIRDYIEAGVPFLCDPQKLLPGGPFPSLIPNGTVSVNARGWKPKLVVDGVHPETESFIVKLALYDAIEKMSLDVFAGDRLNESFQSSTMELFLRAGTAFSDYADAISGGQYSPLCRKAGIDGHISEKDFHRRRSWKIENDRGYEEHSSLQVPEGASKIIAALEYGADYWRASLGQLGLTVAYPSISWSGRCDGPLSSLSMLSEMIGVGPIIRGRADGVPAADLPRSIADTERSSR